MAYDEYEDDEGASVFYRLAMFFALGIWLVYQRYHSIRNRAVPFRVQPPLVSIMCIYFPCAKSDA